MSSQTQIAYTRKQAAEQVGVSVDVIDRAIRSGDVRATRPMVDGRRISTVLVTHEELLRWVTT
jgi:excisionase family DNA binding protein